MNYSNKISTGLIGYPLSHSWSPLIHNSAFRLNNMDSFYQLYEIKPDQLGNFFKDLPENIIGLNVTIPHKERVSEFIRESSDDVKNTGSINTIVNRNGFLSAFNTDVAGIRDSLERFFPVNNLRKFVILGAGGTAKTAVYTLKKYFTAESIMVIYRNEKRLNEFKGVSDHSVRFICFSDKKKKEAVQNAEIIINCTPAGMFPETGVSPLEKNEVTEKIFLFDLIYNPMETRLMKIVRAKGGTAVNGLYMLVVQAAHSFRLFTGKDMPVEKVVRIVSAEMNNK